MAFYKIVKDYIARTLQEGADRLIGISHVPRGLYEMGEYFRHEGSINFELHKEEDGAIVAVSTNFRHGSIITSAKNENELDKNIKDAILTSFFIPSSYAKEADVRRVDRGASEYALA